MKKAFLRALSMWEQPGPAKLLRAAASHKALWVLELHRHPLSSERSVPLNGFLSDTKGHFHVAEATGSLWRSHRL